MPQSETQVKTKLKYLRNTYDIFQQMRNLYEHLKQLFSENIYFAGKKQDDGCFAHKNEIYFRELTNVSEVLQYFIDFLF